MRSIVMLLWLGGCARGLELSGTVTQADGDPWEGRLNVLVAEPGAGDVDTDVDEPLQTFETEIEGSTFQLIVPAGNWDVSAAAGTCNSGFVNVGGGPGDTVDVELTVFCSE